MIYGNVNIFGRIGRIDELRETSNQKMVINFSVAEDHYKADDRGSFTANQVWHKIVAWGAQAHKVSESYKVGDLIFVTGHLKYNKWSDKEGHQRVTAFIDAIKIRLMHKLTIKVAWDDEKDSPKEVCT
ncbi:MAG: single-stranded DNA-binding protein [Bacteriovoracaceae bacterium]|nr:single-stranded DNA-binding protein [Bacteriovoracaceae bacterium]